MIVKININIKHKELHVKNVFKKIISKHIMSKIL